MGRDMLTLVTRRSVAAQLLRDLARPAQRDRGPFCGRLVSDREIQRVLRRTRISTHRRHLRVRRAHHPAVWFPAHPRVCAPSVVGICARSLRGGAVPRASAGNRTATQRARASQRARATQRTCASQRPAASCASGSGSDRSARPRGARRRCGAQPDGPVLSSIGEREQQLGEEVGEPANRGLGHRSQRPWLERPPVRYAAVPVRGPHGGRAR